MSHRVGFELVPGRAVSSGCTLFRTAFRAAKTGRRRRARGAHAPARFLQSRDGSAVADPGVRLAAGSALRVILRE
ncbi:MAG TPA: hypothetical protein VFX41_05060 [Actinomycetales bacterium]|nr:hypothetical protein [Actinomycetales bacterium]